MAKHANRQADEMNREPEVLPADTPIPSGPRRAEPALAIVVSMPATRPRKKDKKLAPGVFQTPSGFRAFVHVTIAPGQTRLVTKRFPKTASLREMRAWRDDQRAQARQRRGPRPDRGTLAEDIERYLQAVAAMPSFEMRRADLDAWREVFGDLRRAQITPAMIQQQLHRWRTCGPVVRYMPTTRERRVFDKPLSASACNHRRTALGHLWTVLDGRDAPNPVRAVPQFREPPPEPRALDVEFLLAAIARLRNPVQRARARVLLWTGIRGNSELARMRPEHVDLARRRVHVPTGKGGLQFRVVPLNEHGVAAWKDFMALNAWGVYDRAIFRTSFIRACRSEAAERGQPAPRVRPYDLRHSIATALLRAGADVADVQAILGHTTPRMTRRYAPYDSAKAAAAADRVGEMLPPGVTTSDRTSDGSDT